MVQTTGEQEAQDGEARGRGEAYGGSAPREDAEGRATQEERRVEGVRHPPGPQPGDLALAAQQPGAEDEVPSAQEAPEVETLAPAQPLDGAADVTSASPSPRLTQPTARASPCSSIAPPPSLPTAGTLIVFLAVREALYRAELR